MNQFPIDLNLVISQSLQDGKRYYDVLDFLFHLNPDELPDETLRQLKMNEDAWQQPLAFYSTVDSTIIHKEGYPFLPLASILRILAKLPDSSGKRIRFWLNRTTNPQDQYKFIDLIAALNNVQTQFSRGNERNTQSKTLSLQLALRVSRKVTRQELIDSNLQKGLEQSEAVTLSYYQLSQIPTIFDVVDTFGRRIRFEPEEHTKTE